MFNLIRGRMSLGFTHASAVSASWRLNEGEQVTARKPCAHLFKWGLMSKEGDEKGKITKYLPVAWTRACTWMYHTYQRKITRAREAFFCCDRKSAMQGMWAYRSIHVRTQGRAAWCRRCGGACCSVWWLHIHNERGHSSALATFSVKGLLVSTAVTL